MQTRLLGKMGQPENNTNEEKTLAGTMTSPTTITATNMVRGGIKIFTSARGSHLCGRPRQRGLLVLGNGSNGSSDNETRQTKCRLKWLMWFRQCRRWAQVDSLQRGDHDGDGPMVGGRPEGGQKLVGSDPPNVALRLVTPKTWEKNSIKQEALLGLTWTTLNLPRGVIWSSSSLWAYWVHLGFTQLYK